MTTAHISEREAQAKAEIGHTTVGRGTAVGLVLAFCVIVLAGSLADGLTGRWAPAFSILSQGPEAAVGAWETQGFFAANRALLAKMDAFEEELEQESAVSGAVQRPFQWVLTAVGGAGNEQVYVGRGGWLYFRPGFDLVTGPGFLDPARLEQRRRSGDSWEKAPEPDPIPAILDLHRYLAERGIQLIVLPAPTKASVHPRPLAPGLDPKALPLHNPSYGHLLERLRVAGIRVVDPAPELVRAARETGVPQYLERDSHWRPEAVGRVAGRIRETLCPPDPGSTHRSTPTRNAMAGPVGADLCVRPGSFARRPSAASHPGDLAALLRLPETHPIWPSQEVEIHQVLGPDGEIVEPDPASPVLLLGDSFTNVYSDASLGWGTGAGLAEQLSFELGFAVDRIAFNAGGASATRRELAARLARGERPLEGKRVVIYQFAARELAVGDWTRLEYEEGEAREAPSPRDEALTVEARVEAVAPVPDPATTP